MTLLFSLVALQGPALSLALTAAPADEEIEAAPSEPNKEEYGPFFEAEPPSDTEHATSPRKKKRTPVLSVKDGAFCFVNGTYCKAALVATAGVAAGMRVPKSDEGPDMPYAHFQFRGGLVFRPLMLKKRDWHPWGVGAIASWSRGTGAVTVKGDAESLEVSSTERTESLRFALLNQLWLSKKQHAFHIDFEMGAVQSEVLTSGAALWGTHAEFGFNWGGWGGVFAGGDFLDRDTRIYFGFRGHGIAAGPIIAMALAGLALGGAL